MQGLQGSLLLLQIKSRKARETVDFDDLICNSTFVHRNFGTHYFYNTPSILIYSSIKQFYLERLASKDDASSQASNGRLPPVRWKPSNERKNARDYSASVFSSKREHLLSDGFLSQ